MLFLAVNILLILALFSVLFFNGGLDGSFPMLQSENAVRLVMYFLKFVLPAEQNPNVMRWQNHLRTKHLQKLKLQR